MFRLPLIAKSPGFAALRAAPLVATLACLLLSAAPAQAEVFVEGEIQDAAKDGIYDLALIVSAHDGQGGPVIAHQNVRIARVSVSEGRFRIALDTGIDAYPLDHLAVEVRFRPFDSFGEFKKGIVSRLST